jgi:hypothetical protein
MSSTTATIDPTTDATQEATTSEVTTPTKDEAKPATSAKEEVLPPNLSWKKPVESTTDTSDRTTWNSKDGYYRVVFSKPKVDGLPEKFFPMRKRILSGGTIWDGINRDRDSNVAGYGTLEEAKEICDLHYQHDNGIEVKPKPIIKKETKMMTATKSKKSASKPATLKATKTASKLPPASSNGKAHTNGKAHKNGKGNPEANGEKKMSAIAAAAKILSTAKEPMTCQALIEAMEKNGLWTSPGGATPAATLSAAMGKEIATKGKESRFKKTAPGLYAATGK